MSLLQNLFVEKYRPQTIEDCILPDRIKQPFLEMVKQESIQNMVLAGPSGCGKTTVARALCRHLNADVLFINASEETGIDILRTKIRTFASSVSLTGSPKVVILDEADFLNATSTQPALRAFTEEFSENCRFIFTCNYKNRLLPALLSRCTVIDFQFKKVEKEQLMKELFKRIVAILKQENIEFDPKVLAHVVNNHYPDFRRCLNEIQKHSTGGKIDAGILVAGDLDIDALFEAMKKKQFEKVREWIVQNLDNDQERIFRKMYDSLRKHTEPATIPTAILLIGEYSYKSAFVVDQEINLMACMVSMMMECNFK